MADSLKFNPEARMLIDGELVEAASGRSYDNINPATEEVIGQTADGEAHDAERAVDAARRAFDQGQWSTDRQLRKRCLEQLRDAMEADKEALRWQTVAEAGSPLQLTWAAQGDTVIEDARWPTARIDDFEWERDLGVHDFMGMKSRRVVVREPVGVVAAITPWNYPLQVNLAKVLPALATGNTVVLKPAPDTPWNATWLGRLAAEHTDMPPGVFNVVTASDPAEVGEFLTADPRVDMVSFTGSTAVGRHIMARSADTVKKVFLELGGKSAHIVLDDADLESTLPFAAFSFVHAGQGCAMTMRWLIPRDRYQQAVELAQAATESLAWGDPSDPSNLMGPLINARQRERVLGYIEKGKAEGARLVSGGGRGPHEKGYYVEPTLFADVDNSMAIAREEIFGPVLCLLPYDGEDEAVSIANDSDYGLSGGVSSASLERAESVARRLRTGTVGINGGMWYAPDSPFGGYRQSGLGREMGLEGFSEYLETKTLGLPA